MTWDEGLEPSLAREVDMTVVLTMRVNAGTVMASDGRGIKGPQYQYSDTMRKLCKTASGVLIGYANGVNLGLQITRDLGLVSNPKLSARNVADALSQHTETHRATTPPISFLVSDLAESFTFGLETGPSNVLMWSRPVPVVEPFEVVGFEKLLSLWFMRRFYRPDLTLIQAGALLLAAIEAVSVVALGAGGLRSLDAVPQAGVKWGQSEEAQARALAVTFYKGLTL